MLYWKTLHPQPHLSMEVFKFYDLKSGAHTDKRRSEGLIFHVYKVQILLRSSFDLNRN